MAGVCVARTEVFEAKKGGYKRHSTHTEIGGQTVAGVLQQYGLQVSNKTFACQRCFSQLKAITRHQNVFMKRKRWSQAFNGEDSELHVIILQLNVLLLVFR